MVTTSRQKTRKFNINLATRNQVTGFSGQEQFT